MPAIERVPSKTIDAVKAQRSSSISVSSEKYKQQPIAGLLVPPDAIMMMLYGAEKHVSSTCAIQHSPLSESVCTHPDHQTAVPPDASTLREIRTL